MSNPFATPAAAGDGIKWAEHTGRLLLIQPGAVETGIQTTFGLTDAVRADIVVLDGPEAGTEYPDCLIFPKMLQSQTKSKVGEKVLGRLGQGVAKPGQSAPWLLQEATPADVEVGKAWLGRVSQPAAAGAEVPPFMQ